MAGWLGGWVAGWMDGWRVRLQFNWVGTARDDPSGLRVQKGVLGHVAE